ncbi:MAG: type I DNA topoisomerase [Nitrospinae bacterium]|nr:type I DNA topoisomerase [Nitrospinota bacterium]
MGKSFVIVESPAKANTIKKYLGKNFIVKASVGHVKDLPKAKLGIDIENNFAPDYITIKGKGKILKELRDTAKKSDRIYLAQDPDREGEAIAWHIANELEKQEKKPIYRVLFNEITKNAVKEAIENPIKIDVHRVNAQQARRILDRLVGYKISPMLWKKVRYGLSAGRVQSVALYLICEREKAIDAFKPEEYWSITANLDAKEPPPFEAKLFKIAGKKAEIKNKEESDSILKQIDGSPFVVSQVEKKERKKNPYPPFITSTLQQDASRRFRFSAKRTMAIAQKLYEGMNIGEGGTAGLITYMRTDSTRISEVALDEARAYIKEVYGEAYLPPQARRFKSKKSAQDGHEAIRPTSVFNTPAKVSQYLEKDAAALYQLIWNRFVASQMEPAVFDVTAVDITVNNLLFRANGMIMRFPGFTAIYNEEADDTSEDKEGLLPELAEGEKLTLKEIIPQQHFTKPPPRYTEATLIKELEDKGIGRPSTYATIISTNVERTYVAIEERRIHPTKLGTLISNLLTKSFSRVLNVEFTAKMEEELDQIEQGNKDWVVALKDFYTPFEKDLKKAEVEMEDVKAKVEETSEVCEKCGSPMVIKWGRFGKFLACTNYPECKSTKHISEEGDKIEEPEKSDKKCDKCGSDMIVKRGRYGKFLACSNYPECKSTMAIGSGIKCPLDGCEGEVVEKRSKRGKVFYGCSKYPECKFASWTKPVAEKCPECGNPFLIEKQSRGGEPSIECPNKECDYKR